MFGLCSVIGGALVGLCSGSRTLETRFFEPVNLELPNKHHPKTEQGGLGVRCLFGLRLSQRNLVRGIASILYLRDDPLPHSTSQLTADPLPLSLPMFTMAKIRGASCYGKYLEENLDYGDYIAEENRVKGEWFGELSLKFGLEGKTASTDDERFENLVDGKNPNSGGKLTQRERSKDDADKAVRIYDFQCSAQKSVSIMALTIGDQRLLQAHDRAVKTAMGELQKFAAVRVRAGDAAWTSESRITGRLCGAMFRHESSRALDPQLHTHCAVFNVTWEQERFFALETAEMLRAIRFGGKLYQSEMARACIALGYEIELAINAKGAIEGFEIKGVSPEIRSRFSKRTDALDEEKRKFRQGHGKPPAEHELERLRGWFRGAATTDAQLRQGWEHGFGREPTRVEIDLMAHDSRAQKDPETIDKVKVHAGQLAQLDAKERQMLTNLRIIAEHNEKQILLSPIIADQSVRAGVAHLYERHSVLSRHELLAEALNQSLGNADYMGLLAAEAHLVDQSQLLSLAPGQITLTEKLATREGVELEHWAVEFVNQTKNTFPPTLPPHEFEQRLEVVQSTMPGKLRPDQKEAAQLICTSEDQVAAVRGVAGSGKTYMLQAADKMLRKEGVKLIYLAPTGTAAKVLTESGLDARTVAGFLLSPGDCQKAMIVCDEAGLQSNIDGIALLRKIEAKGARLRLIGDSRQHVSVAAGDFLRILETHSCLHSVEVNIIERQKAADYKAAVIKLSVGEPIAGLEKLDAIGWVHEGKSAYLNDAAAAFLEKTKDGAEPSQCLAVCPTWRENFALTDAIRAGLRERGRLGNGQLIEVQDSLKWTLQQKRSAKIYQPGMVVSFHQNAFDFRRGESVRVISSDTAAVQVEHEGRTVRLPLSKVSAFDVGTVRTIEIAPGDRILIRSNNSKLGVVNGDLLNVRAIHEDGRIETAEGKTLLGTFREFAHGFVVTSHKSQGQTYNHVVVAAERFDAKAAYVAISRGKFSASIHTPDKEKLLMRDRKLSLRKLPTGDRTAAGDVLAAIEPSKAESIIARMRQVDPLPDRLSHWNVISHKWTQRLQRRAVKFPRWCGRKVAQQFRSLLSIKNQARKNHTMEAGAPRVTQWQSL